MLVDFKQFLRTTDKRRLEHFSFFISISWNIGNATFDSVDFFFVPVWVFCKNLSSTPYIHLDKEYLIPFFPRPTLRKMLWFALHRLNFALSIPVFWDEFCIPVRHRESAFKTWIIHNGAKIEEMYWKPEWPSATKNKLDPFFDNQTAFLLNLESQKVNCNKLE
jgi:hypothetical protein